MIKKLIDIFKREKKNSLTTKTKEYYKSLSNKNLVEQIINLPNSKEKQIKFCTGILIKRKKNQDLEFEITKGLEICHQIESNRIKIFKYLIEEKNILNSNIHKYAKNFMEDRYLKYFMKGSHWNSKNQLLKSTILTDFEIKQCAQTAIKNYKKYIEDSTKNIDLYT